MLFLFAGVDAKQCVKRTKTDKTCQQEDGGDGKQYDTKCSFNKFCKRKNTDEDYNCKSDEAVDITHIFFHGSYIFVQDSFQ